MKSRPLLVVTAAVSLFSVTGLAVAQVHDADTDIFGAVHDAYERWDRSGQERSDETPTIDADVETGGAVRIDDTFVSGEDLSPAEAFDIDRKSQPFKSPADYDGGPDYEPLPEKAPSHGDRSDGWDSSLTDGADHDKTDRNK